VANKPGFVVAMDLLVDDVGVKDFGDVANVVPAVVMPVPDVIGADFTTATPRCEY